LHPFATNKSLKINCKPTYVTMSLSISSTLAMQVAEIYLELEYIKLTEKI